MSVRCFVLLVSVAIAFSVTAADRVRVVSVAPAGIFLEGEPLSFEIAGLTNGFEETKLVLSDFKGKIVREDSIRDRKFTLDCLPRGYYAMRMELKTAGVVESSFVVASALKGLDSGPIAMDVALSATCRHGCWDCPWYGGDTYRAAIEAVRRLGITHVRERMSWAHGNPNPGEYRFGKDYKNAVAFRDAGIGVSEVFHNAPAFAKPDPKLPTDLVALHDWCKKAVERYGDTAELWEYWNEPDIGFAPEAAWEFAATMKAAYLGFKAGDPNCLVLPGSISYSSAGVPYYHEVLYDNGLGYFADAYNYHTYSEIRMYDTMYGWLREFLSRYGLGDQQIWMTEVGTNMEGAGGRKSIRKGLMAHTPNQERIWAAFLPKSQIVDRFLGIARTYSFVFGAYNERGGAKDWGMLRRDGTPKPGCASLATAVAKLAALEIVGMVQLAENVSAYLYRGKDGKETVVYWSDNWKEIPFPAVADGSDVLVTDLCGTSGKLQVRDGMANLVASKYPTYVEGLKTPSVLAPAKPVGKLGPAPLPKGTDATTIITVRTNPEDFALGGNKSRAELRGVGGRMRVSVWNLDKEPRKGRLEMSCGRWHGIPETIAVPARGKVDIETRYESTAAKGAEIESVRFEFVSGNGRSTPCVVRFYDVHQILDGCRSLRIATDDPKTWRRNTSADEFHVRYDESERAIVFEANWKRPNDKWMYPVYDLKLPEETFDGARMITFEVRSEQDKVENDFSTANLMLIMEKGPSIMVPFLPPRNGWEMRYVDLPKKLGKVKGFRLGANPRGDRLKFHVRDINILYPYVVAE